VREGGFEHSLISRVYLFIHHMKQVNCSHYQFQKYIDKPRMLSFWHQIDEVLSMQPESVLEVGPGPGITTDILRKQGIKVTTVDYADDVGADMVASVLSLPFSDGEYDVVLCCEVLEHIEFSSFRLALAEISRVSKRGAIISLPHAGRFWPYKIYLPKIGTVGFGFDLQFFRKKHVFDGQHYWELGKRGFNLNTIKSELLHCFKSVKDFRLLDNPYHHFFHCEK